MNTTTLQKCVDELKKESPDIRYILGMLETYIELNASITVIPGLDPRFHVSSTISKPIVETKVDELTDEQKRTARLYEGGPTGKIT